MTTAFGVGLMALAVGMVVGMMADGIRGIAQAGDEASERERQRAAAAKRARLNKTL